MASSSATPRIEFTRNGFNVWWGGEKVDNDFAMKWAVSYNMAHFVGCLHALGVVFGPVQLKVAAKRESHLVLRWALEKEMVSKQSVEETCMWGVEADEVGVVKCCLRCFSTDTDDDNARKRRVMLDAVRHDSVEVVRYMYDEMTRGAAVCSVLDVIEEILKSVLKNDSIEVAPFILVEARKHNPRNEISAFAIKRCMQEGSMRVLDYMISELPRRNFRRTIIGFLELALLLDLSRVVLYLFDVLDSTVGLSFRYDEERASVKVEVQDSYITQILFVRSAMDNELPNIHRAILSTHRFLKTLKSPLLSGRLGRYFKFTEEIRLTSTDTDTCFDPTCSMCLDETDGGLIDSIVTVCGHAFHATCFKQWMQVSKENGKEALNCPVCRTDVRRRTPPPTES